MASDLSRLSAKINDICSPRHLQSIAEALAKKTEQLYLRGFRDQQDPYGRGWDPLATDVRAHEKKRTELAQKVERARSRYHRAKNAESSRKAETSLVNARAKLENLKFRAGKILIKTGELMRSGEITHVSPSGLTFRVFAPYGIFHEFGTRFMPARMILPRASQGLGRWAQEFERIVASKTRGLLNGRGA